MVAASVVRRRRRGRRRPGGGAGVITERREISLRIRFNLRPGRWLDYLVAPTKAERGRALDRRA